MGKSFFSLRFRICGCEFLCIYLFASIHSLFVDAILLLRFRCFSCKQQMAFIAVVRSYHWPCWMDTNVTNDQMYFVRWRRHANESGMNEIHFVCGQTTMFYVIHQYQQWQWQQKNVTSIWCAVCFITVFFCFAVHRQWTSLFPFSWYFAHVRNEHFDRSFFTRNNTRSDNNNDKENTAKERAHTHT